MTKRNCSLIDFSTFGQFYKPSSEKLESYKLTISLELNIDVSEDNGLFNAIIRCLLIELINCLILYCN